MSKIGRGRCKGQLDRIDFRGSFWGVIGKTITRLPEYVRSEEELQDPVLPYYPYPHFRPHDTLSVDLPDLTDSQGVVRECFGAACSLWSEGAWTSTSITAARKSGVYFWCHYVPVGECDLSNAMAAFAYVDTAEWIEDRMTATLGTPTAWLVEDEGAWDDADKLNLHTDQRKAFCGPGGVGWIDKDSSTVALRYYSKGSGSPVTISVDNPGTVMTDNGGKVVADVSRNKFPLAVGAQVYRTSWGDGSLKRIERVFNFGELAGSSITKPRGFDDLLWSITDLTSFSSLGIYDFERTAEAAPNFPGGNSYTHVLIRDWDIHYSTVYLDQPGSEEPLIERRGFDTALVNSVARGAISGSRSIGVGSDPNGGAYTWHAAAFHDGAFNGIVSEVFDATVGSWDVAQELNDSQVLVDTGIRRIHANYYGFDQLDQADGLSAFVYASLGETSGIYFRHGGAYDESDAIDKDWVDIRNHGDINNGLGGDGLMGVIRIPRDHAYSTEVKPDGPVYMRLYSVGYTYTGQEAGEVDQFTVGPSWSAPLMPDGSADAGLPTDFYDASGGGAPATIDAPMGFWQQGVGGGSGSLETSVSRGIFAIQMAYDTAHPDNDHIQDPSAPY